MNETIAALGRRLRLGVIGGGPGSFIGPVHRAAARLDDRYEVVASVLSSNPDRSKAAGRAIGIPPDRAYGTAEALFDAEPRRDDAIDVIAIMTPNDSHYRLARAALDHGLHVLCDKPLATTVDEAVDLVHRVRRSGRVFCVTYNYSAYPMVRQARDMVRTGVLGAIRMAEVGYVQGHLAQLSEAERGRAPAWRMNPEQAGPSLVLGDIGSHAHHMIGFVTNLDVTQVAAEVGAVVPGRRVDDCAMALLRLSNGAKGTFWVTNAAAGAEHGLSFRIFGDLGGLEWHQENPNYLRHMLPDGPVRILARGGAGLSAAAQRATRVAFGHPEGYQEAFATLYTDVADAIVSRLTGTPAVPLALDFPTVEDGARGVRFMTAALESSRNGSIWQDCSLDLTSSG